MTEDPGRLKQVAFVEPGGRLGPYRIERQIGRGGMSSVFAATHVPLERVVALKVLLPSLSGDPEFVERFLTEARAAARLDYPHIVPIYDSGEIDGVNYIAMKMLEGRDLRSVLQERRSTGQPGLPLARAISICSQAAGALEYAHQHRVVHRDIKPANIYVDDNDRVTLVDFGIARALDRASTTLTGTVLGTPAYMSPEQVRGDPADFRSDIYSLGVVLYEMLAGAAPFRGEAHAVMHAHLVNPPPALASIRPDIPPGVNEVVQRALAKDPQERYQSAGALALALTNSAGGQLARDALADDDATVSYTGAPDTASASASAYTQTPDSLLSATASALERETLPPLVVPAPRRTGLLIAIAGAAAVILLLAVAAWAFLDGPLADTTGRLMVSSEPAGANVTVDGNRLGITPLSAQKLSSGSHQLLLDKPGYIQVKRTETVHARQTDAVNATLTELPAADLLTVQQAVVGKDIGSGSDGTITIGTPVSSVQVDQQFGLVVTLVAKNPREQDVTFRYEIALIDPSGNRLAGSPAANGTIAKGDIAGHSYAFTFSFHRNSDGSIPTGTYQLQFLVGNQVMVTRPITLTQ